MAPKWQEAKVVSACNPAPEKGEILLPSGTPSLGSKRVLVEGNRTSLLMKPGVRNDTGLAACVGGATLGTLGGRDAEVRYRKISFFGVLARDRWLTVQFSVAVLTLAGALVGAYGTWIKNSAEAPASFANGTAVIVFAIATALAITRFVKDYSEI